MHDERLRLREVCVDVDSSHMAGVDVKEVVEICKREGKPRCLKLEEEGRIPPEGSLSLDKKPSALIVDTATTSQELVGRCPGFGVFEVHPRTIVFFVPMPVAIATLGDLAVEDVGVDGVA
jgi:hypothetical protein